MFGSVKMSTAVSTIKKSPKKTPVGKSRYGGTRFTNARSVTLSMSATSKRSGTTVAAGDKQWLPNRAPVTVTDESGLDVTPMPLLTIDPNAIKKHHSIILENSDGTPTDPRSSASAFNKTGAVSSLYGGPFTRSVFSQSETSDSYVDDIHESAADIATTWADIQHVHRSEKEELEESELEKPIEIMLTETATIWLLDIAGLVHMDDEDKSLKIKEENEKYKLLKKLRAGNDLYMERGMNTFNEPPKYKNTQTMKVALNDVGILATTWDMYDTYENLPSDIDAGVGEDEDLIDNATLEADGKAAATPKKSTETQRKESRRETSTFGPSDSMFESKYSFSTIATDSQPQTTDESYIIALPMFKRDLFNMERAVNLNTYQNKQALYRGFPLVSLLDSEQKPSCIDSAMSMPDMGPHVDRLWAYQCHLTKSHNVSCMAWNKTNPDLLAVGYGQFEFNEQKPGVVCCWSLKNPNYPERVFNTTEGVTALDFSRVVPNLLAVGLHNGGIVIYNVNTNKDETVIDSFDCPGKHHAPVWQIQWINKDRSTDDEKTEMLISVSTDGRVTQWSIRKGFEHYDLMKLKRLPNRMQGKQRERKGEAYISRYAGGFTFDFHPNDPNVYLVGTEDSFIHKCSCSYIEQFLEKYSGHGEPVYKIKWSKFEPELFLSCSADWTVRLWHQDQPRAVLVFHSSTKAVYDICWSPNCPTVFACVNEEGVEVWDLSISILDPIIKNSGVSNAKMTCVLFANNSESILVGDSDGQVTVFQLKSMPEKDVQEQSLMKIVDASLANQLTSFDTKSKTDLNKLSNEEFDDIQ